MKKAEWIAQAQRDVEPISALLRTWHPLRRPEAIGDVTITAAGAEAVCEQVRTEVKAKGGGDPVERFKAALSAGDTRAAARLIDEAWFGVPESRDCWRIVGFKEAVELLEDPPE